MYLWEDIHGTLGGQDEGGSTKKVLSCAPIRWSGPGYFNLRRCQFIMPRLNPVSSFLYFFLCEMCLCCVL
jgi:hypothetical protein